MNLEHTIGTIILHKEGGNLNYFPIMTGGWQSEEGVEVVLHDSLLVHSAT